MLCDPLNMDQIIVLNCIGFGLNRESSQLPVAPNFTPRYRLSQIVVALSPPQGDSGQSAGARQEDHGEPEKIQARTGNRAGGRSP